MEALLEKLEVNHIQNDPSIQNDERSVYTVSQKSSHIETLCNFVKS